MIDRRTFGLMAALGFAGSALGARADNGAGPTPAPAAESGAHDMGMMPPEWQGDEEIVFLAYPGMTALDLVGPQYMFASLWGARVRLAARTRDPVRSDTGLVFVPDMTFDEVPEALDLICVPGSVQGALDAMADDATMDFLAAAGARARHVTSVCTGSLLLGQAGLLKGRRATSHWVTLPLLAEFGATPVAERVVTDGNIITGAGVTAGIDFGLSLVAAFRDRTYAEAVQLIAEYAPEPPFDAGRPDTAPPEATALVAGMFAALPERVRAAAAGRR